MVDLLTAVEPEKKATIKTQPLADKLRPQTLDDVVGQDHLLGDGAPLLEILKSGQIPSMIFWGPPGTGKTTTARLLADYTDLEFEPLSAVFSGVADLRKIFDSAKIRAQNGKGTLLFVDEIHRFNRSQQDAFLPVVEDGTIVLVGATTENPSFELNPALLSRTQVFILKRLDDDALEKLLQRAEDEMGKKLPLETSARETFKNLADGDGRYLLTMAERIWIHAPSSDLNIEALTRVIQKRAPLYDKGQEGHYNLISALHKSVRGSDVDAGLYWLSRMLVGGEDPNFIGRRLAKMAYEDIGLADPQAAIQAMTAWQTYERLGSPEGELALAQAVVYLCTAPKSNAVYMAYKAATQRAQETGSLMPPMHAVNAPTKMMEQAGYSQGYQYDHDTPEGFSGQNYFPDQMEREAYYQPVPRGFERDIQKRLDYFNAKRGK